jgi:hypothetical protein
MMSFWWCTNFADCGTGFRMGVVATELWSGLGMGAADVESAADSGEDLLFGDGLAEQVYSGGQGAAGGEQGFRVAGHVDDGQCGIGRL